MTRTAQRAVVGGARLHLGDLRADAVDLGEVAGHTAGEGLGIDLRFHRHTAGDGVQTTGEPEDGRHLSDAHRRGCIADADELSLDVGG